MGAFLAIVNREMGTVLRDRTIVIALLIQLFIASFSSALLLGVLSVYDPDTVVQREGAYLHLGLVGDPNGPLPSYLTRRGLDVVPYATLADAEAAFYRGRLNAILAVPSGSSSVVDVKLYLADKADTANSFIRMVMQEPFKQYENSLRARNGVEMHYADLKGKPSTSFELIYSIILPVLMFFPAFVAGSMAIDSITEEVENNTLPTLLSAPLTLNRMIAAKLTATVILAVAQCAAWLALLQWNGIVVQNLPWVLALAVTVAGLAATAAALGAMIFKDRERSQFVYSLTLLAAVALGTLLDLSPIKTLSRLAIGDAYTNGWSVAVFLVPLAVLYAISLRMSRRLAG